MALTTSLPATTSPTTAESTASLPSSMANSSIDGTIDIAKSPETSPSAATQTVSPTVVTSKPAQSDYANIQSNYDGIVSGMQTQATNVATSNAQKEAQKKIDEQNAQKAALDKQNADTATMAANAKANAVAGTPVTDPNLSLGGKTGYNPLTGKSDTVTDIFKQPDGSYRVSFASDPNQKVVSATDMAKFGWSKDQIAQDQLDKANTDYQTEATNVQNTLNGIQNGSIPLNEGQLAQIEGLKQHFNQFIQQQGLANITASGVANVRGYQTGSAEYDPSFQVKTIGSIITAGQNKIADLNIKMAAAVADMTEGFKTKNANAVKTAWSVYQDAAKVRQDTLKATIENAQKQIKEAQDAKAAADKVVYDTVTKPIDELAKSAAAMGAPSSVTQKILASKDLGSAYEAAGAFASGGTGIIGEYNYYKNQAESKGLTPVDFNTYQTMDANRKAKVAAAGVVTPGAPTSYKEWELAGKPGTYADFVKSQKPATAAQMQVAEYAARIDQAIPTIQNLEKDITGMNYLTFQTQLNMPAAFQSESMQQYMQAARNFINAKLRRESGAVISPTEFSEARAQYLPQPGDTQAVLDQKKANRDLVLQSLKKAAGGAYESANDLLGTADMLNNVEQDAQKQVISLGSQHADLQPQMLQMEKDKVPYSLILKWLQQQTQ